MKRVPAVSEQIREALQEIENARAARQKEKPREIAAWLRQGPAALCQDLDLLMYVTRWDYDLKDPKFGAYAESRGVLNGCGLEGGKYRGLFLKPFKSKASYLKSKDFQFAEPFNGARVRFDEKRMEVGWGIVLIHRAKLQDCWDLFRGGGHGKPTAVSKARTTKRSPMAQAKPKRTRAAETRQRTLL